MYIYMYLGLIPSHSKNVPVHMHVQLNFLFLRPSLPNLEGGWQAALIYSLIHIYGYSLKNYLFPAAATTTKNNSQTTYLATISFTVPPVLLGHLWCASGYTKFGRFGTVPTWDDKGAQTGMCTIWLPTKKLISGLISHGLHLHHNWK